MDMLILLSVEVSWKAALEYHEGCAKQIQDLTLVSIYPFLALCASGRCALCRDLGESAGTAQKQKPGCVVLLERRVLLLVFSLLWIGRWPGGDPLQRSGSRCP